MLAAFIVAGLVLSDAMLSAAELSLAEVEDVIKTFKTVHGRAISEREAWEVLSRSQTDIPRDQYHLLWSLIREQQSPSVSLKALLSLVKAKRDSIQTADFRMHVERVYLTADGEVSPNRSWKQEDHVILSGIKAFCETKRETHGIDIGSAVYRVAFDGERMRTVTNLDGITPSTSVAANRSPGMLVPTPNPLSAALLLDSESSLGMRLVEHDLPYFLEATKPTLYGEPVTANHTKCVLLEDGQMFRVFLDPARDFSVIRFERYHPDFCLESPIRVTKGRALEKVLELNHLQDYGNGIFLPQEIVSTYYVEGKSNVVATVTVDSVQINRPIVNGVFANIVPEDALVADYTRGGIVYKQSDSASIGGLLKETVKSKRSTTLRTVSIAVGVVLIAIVVARRILVRRRAA